MMIEHHHVHAELPRAFDRRVILAAAVDSHQQARPRCREVFDPSLAQPIASTPRQANRYWLRATTAARNARVNSAEDVTPSVS